MQHDPWCMDKRSRGLPPGQSGGNVHQFHAPGPPTARSHTRNFCLCRRQPCYGIQGSFRFIQVGYRCEDCCEVCTFPSSPSLVASLTLRFYRSDAEIRANVYKSLVLNSLSLLSIYVFDLLLQPLVKDEQNGSTGTSGGFIRFFGCYLLWGARCISTYVF